MKFISTLLIGIFFLHTSCVTYRNDWPTEGSFSGTLMLSFEISSFTPEGSKEKWWFEGDLREEIKRITLKAGHKKGTTLLGKYKVEFEGRLAPKGHYGHLAQYKRKIQCLKLIDLQFENRSSANQAELTIGTRRAAPRTDESL